MIIIIDANLIFDAIKKSEASFSGKKNRLIRYKYYPRRNKIVLNTPTGAMSYLFASYGYIKSFRDLNASNVLVSDFLHSSIKSSFGKPSRTFPSALLRNNTPC